MKRAVPQEETLMTSHSRPDDILKFKFLSLVREATHTSSYLRPVHQHHPRGTHLLLVRATSF
jgi:hypothetical protein